MFFLSPLVLILFLSGFIHGLVGFAFALTALPLLALFIGIKKAVPLLSLFSFTVNFLMLLVLKEKRLLKIPFTFFITIILGVLIGIKGFSLATEKTLRWILFIAIFIYFLWEIYQLKNSRKRDFTLTINPTFFNSYLSLGIAFLVGLLGGLLNTPGPPIVMYLSFLNFDKNLFKATLQLIFTFTSFTSAINHYLVGNLSIELVKLYVTFLPFVLVGLYLGQKFYTKISTKVYYYLVNLFLLISAFLLLMKDMH
ncbi:MAG: sulfite exporter TauE/SafE family protein [Thermodesulfobacteriaceae bacterium]|nr:sulfite exporter TauE/SafE family protein [Thermodesulfobacteriaceae bacterium]